MVEGGRGVGASFSGRSLHSSKFTSSEVATKQGWLPRNTSVGRRVLIYGCAGLPGLPAGRGWPCLMIRCLIHGQSCRTDQAPAGEQARDNSVHPKKVSRPLWPLAFTSRIITVSGQSRERTEKERENKEGGCGKRMWSVWTLNKFAICVVMFVSLAIRVTAKSSQLFQGFAYPVLKPPGSVHPRVVESGVRAGRRVFFGVKGRGSYSVCSLTSRCWEGGERYSMAGRKGDGVVEKVGGEGRIPVSCTRFWQ